MEYDILVVGAGPAGLSAGIYAARAGYKVGIIEKMYAGGQATLTYEIENYPGFENISGADLAMRMQAQAEKCGAEMIYDEVTQMQLTGENKVLTLAGAGEVGAKAVILCTGASPRKIGIAAEDKFIGRGVSYCATCDGAFYKNKTVMVIGGGNTAVEDALYLTKFASKVYIVHRRQEFRASKVLVERLNQSDVEKVLDCVVVDIKGDKKIESVEVENIVTNENHIINVDGIFVAIGQLPSNEVLSKDVARDEHGYVLTDEDMRTNLEGVFCAGDIRHKSVRQVVTACSDGAIAGEMAAIYLR